MDFEIKNNTDGLSIFINDEGSYISYNDNPLTVIWNYYYHEDEIDNFISNLPHNPKYRDAVNNSIPSNTDIDFSDNIQGLYDFLSPWLKLLKNGKYELKFISDKENKFFSRTMKYQEKVKSYLIPLTLYFTNTVTDIKKLNEIRAKYNIKWKKGKYIEKDDLLNLLKLTGSFNYDENRDFFYSTIPKESLNNNRITYYEKELRKGKRPFIILFNSYDYNSELSHFYVIDGHHKLLAYKNLNLYPPLVICTRKNYEKNFDVKKLSNVLYPWQIEYILDGMHHEYGFIDDILAHKSNRLNQFLKNGCHKGYYPNGKLKYELNFLEGRRNGIQKHWYENGQLKSESFFNKGINIGISKSYTKEGNLRNLHTFNEIGQLHGVFQTYYENGTKSHEAHYMEGKNITSSSWYKNGKKSSATTFDNHKIIEQKNWDLNGDMVSHKKMDIKTKELVELFNTKNFIKYTEEKDLQKRQPFIQLLKEYLKNKLNK